MNTILVCSLTLLLCISVSSQGIEDEFDNTCQSLSGATCAECIKKSTICAWCGAETFSGSRCDIKKNLKFNNCSDSDITAPESSQSITQDNDYTSGNQNEPPVQVRPQKMSFKVRPNDARNFVLSFQLQKDYPVDLYLLFDITQSINSRDGAKKKLVTLGTDLPKGMENITKNFRLGYGSFVDKYLMPYSAWTAPLLKNRCPSGQTCKKPHLFKNEAELGVTPDVFADRMTESLKTLSQSMDDTEGGLEALIQVLGCTTEIGWKKNSRKIVVYSSNSKFHTAGAGKLGGATKQGIMSCEMVKDEEHYSNKVNDYPSVSQVADKLSQTGSNVIFAVTDSVRPDYDYLRSFLDSAKVGTLDENANNIVDLIKTQYEELKSAVEFRAASPDHVDIQFQSKCLGNKMERTAECGNLQIGSSVNFNVTMTVRPEICGKSTDSVKKDVSIFAVGLNEELTIELEVICGCDCEKPEFQKKDKSLCHFGNGTLVCGKCACSENRYGRNCECDETEISNEKAQEDCRKDNTTAICSNQGECICGVCNCFPISAKKPEQLWDGDFCNCNNFNCLIGTKSNELCGGPTRGFCDCGKCNCNDGWEGEDCECTKDTSTCMTANNVTCNGHGTCECGKCQCFTNTEKKMSGPTCEDCLDCPPKCDEYIDCAQCIGFGTGSIDNIDQCQSQCKDKTEKVSTLSEAKGFRRCEGTDDDGCKFYFTYTYTNENDVSIEVQETKECPEEAPVAAIVGGIVGAVVLIPLLLIIIFIFIRNRRDAKEFADFMKERERAKWDSASNPIYKDPKSTFQNPTYKGGN